MKLYLAAGMHLRGVVQPLYRSGWLKQPQVLLSYYDFKRHDIEKAARPFAGELDIFADSGAFSAWRNGFKIRLADYRDWVGRWSPFFDAYANLDVIGDPEETAYNQAWLEKAGLRPVPVFHYEEDWELLDRLCDRYSYVALGGMVSRPPLKVIDWTKECFKIAGRRAVFHGFGQTDWRCIKAMPWYSVDSTAFKNGHKFGNRMTFDPERGFPTAPGDPRLIEGARYNEIRRTVAALTMGAMAYMKARDWINENNPPVEIPGREERDREATG